MTFQTDCKDIMKKKILFAISLSLGSLLFSIHEDQIAFAQDTHVVNIPMGAADPGAPYFWQVESTGDTNGEISIHVNDIVEWENTDSAAHTVTAGNPGEKTNGMFDSGLFGPGESFSYQFTQEGKFDYFCLIHPWMLGMVTVQAATPDDNGDDSSNASSGAADSTTVQESSSFPFSQTAVIVIPLTYNNENCKELENCYLPMHLHVEKDTLVTWYNFDDEPRSIVSGNIVDGQDGIFESGLLNPGESFSHRFETQKIHEYYDILRPWETGKITVTGKTIDKDERMTIIEGMSADGTITVVLEAMNPIANKAMGIHAKFLDMNESLIERINYDLTVAQNGRQVLALDDNHSHAGIEEHWTDVLDSDDPVDVKITILGIGLPGEESDWTGPSGEVVTFHVVPEFGTIAAMILAVAIISLVVITKTNRLATMIPKL